jgi:hypothetical protein
MRRQQSGKIENIALFSVSLTDMNASRSLTEFQQKCEAALCSALAARGLTLTNRTLAGLSETYIYASVHSTDIMVYIYENEA